MINGLIKPKYGQDPVKSWIVMLTEVEFKNLAYQNLTINGSFRPNSGLAHAIPWSFSC